MTLNEAKQLAQQDGSKQIYRSSKPFHIRGIATDFSDPEDVAATDWEVYPRA